MKAILLLTNLLGIVLLIYLFEIRDKTDND